MNQQTKTKNKFRDQFCHFVKDEVGVAALHDLESKVVKPTELDTDIIVVGSSIVHMARALVLASFGARVTVLEQSRSYGGVWSTAETVGLTGVERAPHIFMPCKIAYRFIETVIGIEMVEMDPHPMLITLNENYALQSRGCFPSTPVTSHPNVMYEGVCRQPNGGANVLFKKLIRLGEKMGIRFVSEAYVKTLSLMDCHVKAKGSFGEVTGRRVVMSRGSPVTHIYDGHAVIIPYRSSTNISLHLLVEATMKPGFSFVHVDGHPLIKEIHDISNCTKGIATDRRLIIVKLRYNIFEQNDLSLIDSKEVFEDLVGFGLFASTNRVVESEITGYAQTRIGESAIEDLSNRYEPCLDIVPFSTLADKSRRADLCAQDMSVSLSAKEFYQTLAGAW